MSIAAVRDLHIPSGEFNYGKTRDGEEVRIRYCMHDGFAWPCPTMQALDLPSV